MVVFLVFVFVKHIKWWARKQTMWRGITPCPLLAVCTEGIAHYASFLKYKKKRISKFFTGSFFASAVMLSHTKPPGDIRHLGINDETVAFNLIVLVCQMQVVRVYVACC